MYNLTGLAKRLGCAPGADLCKTVEALSFEELRSVVGQDAAEALWEHNAAWYDAGCPEDGVSA